MSPRPKAARLSACALALAFGAASALAPSLACAQDDDDDGPAVPPVVVQIQGPCALTVDARAADCRGVAYMVFPSNGRIDFTAITARAGWAFSGENDENADGQYTLEVDSVLTPTASRLDAEGECDMIVADDKRTVNSLECRAETDQGVLTLRASGVIVADDSND